MEGRLVDSYHVSSPWIESTRTLGGNRYSSLHHLTSIRRRFWVCKSAASRRSTHGHSLIEICSRGREVVAPPNRANHVRGSFRAVPRVEFYGCNAHAVKHASLDMRMLDHEHPSVPPIVLHSYIGSAADWELKLGLHEHHELREDPCICSYQLTHASSVRRSRRARNAPLTICLSASVVSSLHKVR